MHDFTSVGVPDDTLDAADPSGPPADPPLLVAQMNDLSPLAKDDHHSSPTSPYRGGGDAFATPVGVDHLRRLLGRDEPRPHAATVAASVARLLAEHPQCLIGNEPADAPMIGSTVHSVVAILAPLVEEFTTVELAEVTLGLSRGMCSPGRMHRRNATLVAGFAAEYLRGRARPRPPWVCVDTEAQTTGGVVDLVWQHRETARVFIDEVKTTQVPRRALDKGWVEQAHRYAVAGQCAWGDLFAGVRLLPLGSMHLAALFDADGTHRTLAPTMTDPLAQVATR